MRLVTLAVQERSIDQGLHTHVLVGVPDGSLGLKTIPCRTSVPTLITNTWVALDERGRRSANAQDSQDIYDLEGARRYVMKTIRSAANLIDYDFLNTIAPDA